MGASRFTTFRRVVLPSLAPAIGAGAALSFARAISEYGSLVLLSGNLAMRTEVTSVRILTYIENGNTAAAAAVASTLLLIALIVIVLVDIIQRRVARRVSSVADAPELDEPTRRQRRNIRRVAPRSPVPVRSSPSRTCSCWWRGHPAVRGRTLRRRVELGTRTALDTRGHQGEKLTVYVALVPSSSTSLGVGMSLILIAALMADERSARS